MEYTSLMTWNWHEIVPDSNKYGFMIWGIFIRIFFFFFQITAFMCVCPSLCRAFHIRNIFYGTKIWQTQNFSNVVPRDQSTFDSSKGKREADFRFKLWELMALKFQMRTRVEFPNALICLQSKFEVNHFFCSVLFWTQISSNYLNFKKLFFVFKFWIAFLHINLNRAL